MAGAMKTLTTLVLALWLTGCASHSPDAPARIGVRSGLEEISIVALGME